MADNGDKSKLPRPKLGGVDAKGKPGAGAGGGKPSEGDPKGKPGVGAGGGKPSEGDPKGKDPKASEGEVEDKNDASVEESKKSELIESDSDGGESVIEALTGVEGFKRPASNFDYNEISEAVLNLMLSEGRNVLMDDYDLFSFIGFNPVDCAKELRAKNDDDEEFGRDMTRLMLYILNRGPSKKSFEKKKMSKEGVDLITKICMKYEIKNKASDAVGSQPTLSRVTAAFPHIFAKLIKITEVEPTGPKAMDQKFNCLCFPGAASMIPRNFKKLRKSHKDWQLKLDLWLNKVGAKEKKDNDAEMVERYWSISHDADLFSEEARIVLMEQLELEDNSFDVEDID